MLPPHQESFINNPGTVGMPMEYREFLQYRSFCQGIEDWSFDIFYYSEAVPMPLRGIVLILMDKLGLLTVPNGKGPATGEKGLIGAGKVPVTWATACAYFEVRQLGQLDVDIDCSVLDVLWREGKAC